MLNLTGVQRRLDRGAKCHIVSPIACLFRDMGESISQTWWVVPA